MLRDHGGSRVPFGEGKGPGRRRLLAGCLATLVAGPWAPAWAGNDPHAERMRNVVDGSGRTVAIPAHPERIVVMHEPLLGIPLMDLGVEVVGAYGRDSSGRFATRVDFVEALFGPGRAQPRGFGALGQIDLEQLRALRPDLIIGSELDTGKLERLSSVAPVYVQPVGFRHVQGIDVERRLAALLGREAVFGERWQMYQKRVSALKSRLPGEAGKRSWIAVLLTDQVNVVGNMSGLVQAMADLGYVRLALPETGADGGLGSTLLMPVNVEVFGRLDPDLLVVMNNYTSAHGGETATKQALNRLMPGWERFLKPAREGRMVFMDSSRVTTPSIQSALYALDGMEQWIGQQSVRLG